MSTQARDRALLLSLIFLLVLGLGVEYSYTHLFLHLCHSFYLSNTLLSSNASTMSPGAPVLMDVKLIIHVTGLCTITGLSEMDG